MKLSWRRIIEKKKKILQHEKNFFFFLIIYRKSKSKNQQSLTTENEIYPHIFPNQTHNLICGRKKEKNKIKTQFFVWGIL